MNISGISANDSAFGATSNTGTTNLGKDAFMTLLVEQLKNQDPLDPTTNEQFVSELANFSSLEQMEELNENLLGMVVLQQSNALLAQLTESSGLIGKSVRYYDPATQGILDGEVSSVKLEDGLAQLNIGGKNVPLGNVTEVLGDVDPVDTTDTSTED
jgi:flagellar basal-body rod modification protein FlgD